jgi:hypothetical protein
MRVVGHRTVGGDGSHLQLHLVDGRTAATPGPQPLRRAQQALPTIAFRQGQWAGCLPPLVDVAYRIGVSHWQGARTLATGQIEHAAD